MKTSLRFLSLALALLLAPLALSAATNGASYGLPDDFTTRVVVSAATPFRLIGLGSTNATSLKATPGQVVVISIQNVAAAVRYVKFYNKASAPTVGTDTPVFVIGLPASSAVNLSLPAGLYFSTGIAFATTNLSADTDATAITAGDLIISLGYN